MTMGRKDIRILVLVLAVVMVWSSGPDATMAGLVARTPRQCDISNEAENGAEPDAREVPDVEPTAAPVSPATNTPQPVPEAPVEPTPDGAGEWPAETPSPVATEFEASSPTGTPVPCATDAPTMEPTRTGASAEDATRDARPADTVTPGPSVESTPSTTATEASTPRVVATPATPAADDVPVTTVVFTPTATLVLSPTVTLTVTATITPTEIALETPVVPVTTTVPITQETPAMDSTPTTPQSLAAEVPGLDVLDSELELGARVGSGRQTGAVVVEVCADGPWQLVVSEDRDPQRADGRTLPSERLTCTSTGGDPEYNLNTPTEFSPDGLVVAGSDEATPPDGVEVTIIYYLDVGYDVFAGTYTFDHEYTTVMGP